MTLPRPGSAAGPRRDGWRPRPALLAAVVAAICLAVIIALAAALTQIRSPEQLRAQAAPPPPAILTATVHQRILAQTLTYPATLTAGGTADIGPVDPPAGRRPVISAAPPAAGALVTAGQAVLEVAGRPVFVLRGAVPAYRDLRTGDTGPDVTQLQAALRETGRRITDRRGVFGPSTQAAVTQLYHRAGYEPEDSLPMQPASSPASSPATSPAASPGPAQSGNAQQSRRDVLLPATSIVYVPSLPARVLSTTQIGRQATAAVMRLGYGAAVAVASIESADALLVRPGMHASVTTGQADSGQPAAWAGEVRSIAPAATAGDGATDPGAAGVGGAGTSSAGDTGAAVTSWTMVVGFPGPAPAASTTPGSASVAVTLATTTGPVLVVPVTAISQRADGATTVTVITPSGQQRVTAVRTGLAVTGYSEVTPVQQGALRDNDQVLVGSV